MSPRESLTLLEQKVSPTAYVTEMESPLLSTHREHKAMVSPQRTGHTLENTTVATEMEDDCMSHQLKLGVLQPRALHVEQ